MKRKILWLGLSFLLVAALVLTACPAPVGEQEEEEEEEEEDLGLPQRGGTLTILHEGSADTIASPADVDGYWSGFYLSPMREFLLLGDFEKYGPRGTGEDDFVVGYVAPKFYGGHLIEDWEVYEDHLIFHVRPGIYWAADNVDWMPNRELVAQDIVDQMIYMGTPPQKGWFLREHPPWEVYTTSRYTLRLDVDYHMDWLSSLIGSGRMSYAAPERIAAGAEKWENQVGTGPFIFEMYAVGSYITFTKNPNYWKTTFIDGVEYELPFINRVVMPILPDVSTQMAALRTGQVDWMDLVPAIQWETLEATAPGIILKKTPGSTGAVIYLKCDEPPFDDVEVRRAMMMALDFEALADLHGLGPLPIHWFPVYTEHDDFYIPLEDLPSEAAVLYSNDPDEARRILDLAGIPVGFKVDLWIDGSEIELLDRGALVKDMLIEAGIDVQLRVEASPVISQMLDDRTYTGGFIDYYSGERPIHTLYRECLTAEEIAAGDVSTTGWSDLYYNELVFSLQGWDALALSEAETASIFQEASLIRINAVPQIPLDVGPVGTYWWPWLKNYYGEINVKGAHFMPVLTCCWLDLDLKADMGY